ncbi:hypothetical protein ACHQM5_003285 [Ranunculus cassubicifolius]
MADKKPLTTSEAIVVIEKKMNMTLDDLIKNSKKETKNASTEKKTNTRRFSNKTQKPFHNPSSASARVKSSKVQRFMDSGSSHRHAAFALRRSKFQENQFSVAIEAGKRVTYSAPTYRKPVNGKRIDKWNKPRDGFPPVQRRGAIVYVATKKWHNQDRVVLPKQTHVEATRKKSVWQRLNFGPSRNQF